MYALAQIIGVGTGEDPYRANVSGSGFHSLIKSKTDGHPKFAWCLVECFDIDNATGTGLFKLPTIGLDEPLVNITPILARTGMITELTGKGIDVSNLTDQSTMRDVVRIVGKHQDGAFDI